VVEYVCREMPQQWSSMILNAQDSNGDTALSVLGTLPSSTACLGTSWCSWMWKIKTG
jgi:hypothetical protein